MDFTSDETNTVIDNDEVDSDNSLGEKNDLNAKYFDDMPSELVEYLIKTNPLNKNTGDEKTMNERKITYATPQKTLKRNVPERKDHTKLPSYMNFNKIKLPKTTTIILSVSIAVLLIFMFLIFKINSTNSNYEEALAQIKEIEKSADELVKVKDENKILVQKVSTLTAELENYTGSPDSGDSSNSGDSSTPSDTSTQTEKTYTVVSGDNLSRISQKFYGSPNHYDKIMAENNITNPAQLKVGAVLKIPPLQ